MKLGDIDRRVEAGVILDHRQWQGRFCVLITCDVLLQVCHEMDISSMKQNDMAQESGRQFEEHLAQTLTLLEVPFDTEVREKDEVLNVMPASASRRR